MTTNNDLMDVISTTVSTTISTTSLELMDIEWSYADTLAITFLLIGFIIYLPTVIYLAYPLWHSKNQLIFQKRHIDLTLYSIYSLAFSVIMTSLINLMTSPVVFGNRISVIEFIFYVAINILLQFSVQFFYSTLFIRLWLTLFDIKYNIIIGMNEWKSILDKNYNASNSWFVRYRTSLGNKKVLIKVIWIINILFVATDVILFTLDILSGGNTTYSSTFSTVYLLFVVITYCIFATILYCLLRKVEYFDDFHILNEFVMFYKIVMAIICIVILYLIIFVLINHSKLLWIITVHFLIQSWIICNICIVYVMSRWVFKQLKNDVTLQSQYGELLHKLNYIHTRNSTTVISTVELTDVNDEKTDNNQTKEITLQHILSKIEYICSFMEHLSREFSNECLLSMIEFIQYRNTIKSADHDNHTKNALIDARLNEELREIKLPLDIPKSSIVFDNELNDKAKAELLYNKYIKIGCEYEINISSKNRNALAEIFENSQYDKDNNKAFSDPFIFDRTCEDMVRLLSYSFSRFQSKPQFRKLELFAV